MRRSSVTTAVGQLRTYASATPASRRQASSLGSYAKREQNPHYTHHNGLTSLISPPEHSVGHRLAPLKERQHASVLTADPLHREVEAVLFTTFGQEVEVLVNTVEHVDAAATTGIGVEYLTSLILGEDANCCLV
jgi:hypothetical protein